MFFAVHCVKVLTELAEVNQPSLNLLSWRFPVQIQQAGLDSHPLKAEQIFFFVNQTRAELQLCFRRYKVGFLVSLDELNGFNEIVISGLSTEEELGTWQEMQKLKSMANVHSQQSLRQLRSLHIILTVSRVRPQLP